MSGADTASNPHFRLLRRELDCPAAVMMGLGAMLGTGVFITITAAASDIGPALPAAILVAGFSALCNALSSAQLAAEHPVSGGTYEHGHRHLSPSLGFSAGWLFLTAKSASAASAALGFSEYARALLNKPDWPAGAIAAAIVLAVCALAALGARRSAQINTAIVSVTVLALLLFAGLGLNSAWTGSGFVMRSAVPVKGGGFSVFLETCALLFVAFTGYGRIATMGEEVREPRKNIPKAIVISVVLASLIYLLVGAAGLAAGLPDAPAGSHGSAPLTTILRSLGHGSAAIFVALGALTAMAGVLLNLLLGLSRVLLAMARRGDAPGMFAKLDRGRGPRAALLAVGGVAALLSMSGNIGLTWSFSAFTVLVYYAITNLAALRLPPEARLHSRFFAWAGLASCLFLAFQVDRHVWAGGTLLLLAGLAGRRLARSRVSLSRG